MFNPIVHTFMIATRNDAGLPHAVSHPAGTPVAKPVPARRLPWFWRK